MIAVHATAHKAGSTWFRLIFQEKHIWEEIGMKTAHWQVDLGGGMNINYSQAEIVEIPDNTISYCTYCDYEIYARTTKDQDAKTFYLMRDPRELVVSTYYSWKNTHGIAPQDNFLRPRRDILNKLDKTNGLIFVTDDLLGYQGIFGAQRSWAEAEDADVMMVKFEDFFGERQPEIFASILDHCELSISKEAQKALLSRFSFRNLSGGRQRGQVNNKNHWRSGIADSWRTEMPKEALEHFYKKTEDLVEALGYQR